MKICKIYSLKWSIALLFILLFSFVAGEVLGIDGNKPYQFTIIASDTAMAGEPFTVKIIVKDEFDNVITNYNKVGGDVEIITTGPGTISSTLVAASEFKKGIATVDVVYDKAGRFVIIATEKEGRLRLKLKAEKEARKAKLEAERKRKAQKTRIEKEAKRKLREQELARLKVEKEQELRLKRQAEAKRREQERIEKEAKHKLREVQEARLKAEAEERHREQALLRKEKELEAYKEKLVKLIKEEKEIKTLEEELAKLKTEKEEKLRLKRGAEKVVRVRAREYIIGEGDVLFISIWQEETLSEEVIVRPDGKISFPLAGDVPVKGLTFTQLEEELTQRLKDYIKYPLVFISLRKIGGKKVIVMGEVNGPGIYSVTGKSTALEGIASAGGFTSDAVVSSVILIRGGLQEPKGVRLNLTRAIEKGDFKQNVSLQPEDIIYVPKKFISNVNWVLNQILGPLSQGIGDYRTIQEDLDASRVD